MNLNKNAITHKIHQDIVQSLRTYPQGAFMILAQGISIPNIIYSLITNFLEKSNLILLINFSNSELQLMDSLLTQYIIENPDYQNKLFIQSINHISKLNTDKRKQQYLAGGVLSLSNQILVQDLLSAIIEPSIITHIIINKAHYINGKYDLECFLAHLIKTHNPQVFLLAISDQPQLLSSRLQDIIRPLFINQILLWPFNRVEILSQCAQVGFSWTDHTISMQKSEQSIQTSLLTLIDECIQELNRRLGDSQAIKTQPLLHSNKQKIVSLILKLQQSHRNINLVENQYFLDMFKFKHMLFKLVESKPINFYKQVKQITSDSNLDSILYVCDQNVGGSVNMLNNLSKQRVYIISQTKDFISYKCPIYDFDNEFLRYQQIKIKYNITLNIKTTGKFKMIAELLTQFSEKFKNHEETIRIWIWTKYKHHNEQTFLVNYFILDDRLDSLNQMYSLKIYLNRSLVGSKQQYEQILADPNFIEQDPAKLQKGSMRKQEVEVEIVILFILEHELNEFFKQLVEIQQAKLLGQQNVLNKNQDIYQMLPKSLLQLDIKKLPSSINDEGLFEQYDEDKIISGFSIVVNSYDDASDRSIFLRDYKPNLIIICDPLISILRELMLENQGFLFSVHTLFYQNSIESQIFYKDKLDEDYAFEQLIEQCSKMPIFNDLPNDTIEHFKIPLNGIINQSTRIGRGEQFFQQKDEIEFQQQQQQQQQYKPIIIVDFRDFRSQLPAILYYSGFNVIPLMLKTGDYVLSNQVIIERKSVETGDLCDSIQNKRLYEQLKRLSEFQYPFLLIEYSERINFNLESLSNNNFFMKQQKEQTQSKQQDTAYQAKQYNNKHKILINLIQILIQYPKVQLLWSKSARNSAQIIKKLKMTIAKSQPDIENWRKMGQKEIDVIDVPIIKTDIDNLDMIIV